MMILLRLDTVFRDSVGWMATFYGKPDIHGNTISIPVSRTDAHKLEKTVGKQFLFELKEIRD